MTYIWSHVPHMAMVSDTSDRPHSDVGNDVRLYITLSKKVGRDRNRAQKDHINIGILPTMVSGILLVLVLGTRM